LIKDKEFIIFKLNLFNIYYFSLILLSIFLFNSLGVIFLFKFKLLFCILLIYSILLTNFITLKLFYFYLKFKKIINLLETIKTDISNLNKNNSINLNKIFKNRASFNTSAYKYHENKKDYDSEKSELELDYDLDKNLDQIKNYDIYDDKDHYNFNMRKFNL